jgi:cell division protein FtsW
MKPFFFVVTGWILSLKYEEDFPSFQVAIFLYTIVATLLLLQPDFGMLVLVTAVFGLQIFAAGLPLIWVVGGVLISVFGVLGAYMTFPHVANRINNILDPSNSENFQVSKSIMAYSEGGIYGKGPGEGSVKLHLPDSHTDFIMAVSGEEFGALICLVIIACFAFIVIRNIKALSRIDDKFTLFAALGLVSQFGFQAIINMGVTLNMLPTKGMTLPLISYGGSSTLSISIVLGLLLGLVKHRASFNSLGPKRL